jgi:hypothetical protein
VYATFVDEYYSPLKKFPTLTVYVALLRSVTTYTGSSLRQGSKQALLGFETSATNRTLFVLFYFALLVSMTVLIKE